ncbi:hypothetical protein GCM10009738_14870 [Kitasatospora viridis]|uniref:Uncharacterized protein n=1 Tax=Kitasatospora viridis TaxID=281105 RepID=A0A561TV47_9ACTN|nr:hypothetical protein [Kitasatospora viridis]TWF90983.1 hypothetical protein FHX73_1295 [Kitasatospora viridis]
MYLAYYLHWSPGDLLDLAHPVRARVIAEVGRIHQRLETDAAAGRGR